MAQVAHGACGIPFLGDIQEIPGHGPEQLAVDCPT